MIVTEIVGDRLDEQDETFFVNLSNLSNATLAFNSSAEFTGLIEVDLHAGE